MPEKFATEFTPEMSQSYLDSLTADIDQMGRVDEGRALAEQAARGTLGQQTADSAVGSVRTGVRNQKSRTIGAFNLDVANKRREERLGEKSRGWSLEDQKSSRDFAAAEAAKSRDFQERMARIGYDFQREQDEFDPGGFVAGLGSSVISSGVGGYLGGMGYARGRGR